MEEGLWIAWPKGSDGEETRSVLVEEYRDHGAWARHYSTVRMTIGTFFLSAATGIIYLRWDKPEYRTAVLAAIILGIGVVLFLRFSWLTFKEMNSQRRIVSAYRTSLGKKEEETPKALAQFWKWDAAYICIAVVLFFAAFDLFWLLAPPGSSKTVDLSIPITVQIGEAPAASFQVPVKVTVPEKADR